MILYLTFKFIRNNIKIKFVLHLLLNFILCSIINPLCLNYANELLINNNIKHGIMYIVVSIIISLITTYHTNTILEFYRRSKRYVLL